MDQKNKRNQSIEVNSNEGLEKDACKVSYNSRCSIDNPTYSHILDKIKQQEKKLEKTLDFTVRCDYIVLEALRKLECNELQTVFDILGNDIFLFITDLELQKFITRSDNIASDFCGKTTLLDIKKYYGDYNDIVMHCIKNNVSSLYLFKVLQGYIPRTYMNNICSVARYILHPKELILIAQKILVEFFMFMDEPLHSEKGKDEFTHKITKINECILSIPDCTFSRFVDNTHIVDSLYDYIQ